MPIEMPKGLTFSVDTWTPSSNCKRYHILTHAHRDHISGISSHSSYPVYCSRLTKTIVLRYFPQLQESVFVEIEVGETVVIKDPNGAFSVTAFDANHCPGAVMFLFGGEFGKILHTGDCRLTPDCRQYLPMKYITKKGRDTLCHLDYLFLDFTFARCSLKIPSKQSAIRQVINCIWKHPDAPVVYLACDTLGEEEILVQIFRTFGSKIYVDKENNSECYHALLLVAPEILSQDASSRFQVIEGFPRLNERASQKLAEAQAKIQPGPLFVRPSAQWYASNYQSEMTQREKPGLAEAVRDEFGVRHVCYSMHSSRGELEWALQLLQTKWVNSTTPPCRAMELDYVKNHCFKTHITPDDPLWKLLKVGTGKSASLLSSTAVEVSKNVSATSVVEVSAASVESNQLQLKEPVNNIKLKLDLPSPSSTRTMTLFGRARLGLQDTDLLQEENKSEPNDVKNESEVVISQENVIIEPASDLQGSSIADLSVDKLVGEVDVKRDICMGFFKSLNNAEPSVEKSFEEGNVVREMFCVGSTRSFDFAEISVENMEVTDVERDVSCIGSSKSFNASLRNLYRSVNVPVPRPLPSLVELMGGSKRVKLGSESSPSRLNYYYNSIDYLSS